MTYEKARAAADEYRKFWEMKGGYIYVYRGEATGWSRDLTSASGWKPGVLACADTGEIFKRVLGSPQWEQVHE